VDSSNAARGAGVERRWLFFLGSLHALTLILHLPELAASIPSKFWDLAELVRLPGCVPIPVPMSSRRSRTSRAPPTA
jgi:hydroquinone glucosyltransferase